MYKSQIHKSVSIVQGRSTTTADTQPKPLYCSHLIAPNYLLIVWFSAKQFWDFFLMLIHREPMDGVDHSKMYLWACRVMVNCNNEIIGVVVAFCIIIE